MLKAIEIVAYLILSVSHAAVASRMTDSDAAWRAPVIALSPELTGDGA
jgi:hypothetical protein